MRQHSIDLPGASHAAPIPMACRIGPILASSAIGGRDPATGQLPADIDGQVQSAFRNIEAVLTEAGMDMGDVVKITVLCTEDSARDAVNTLWLRHYPDPQVRPARHTHVSALRGGMLVQFEILAVAKDA